MLAADNEGTSSLSHCDVFHIGIPTFEELRNNPPPEYLPLMVIGGVTTVISLVIMGAVIKKHILYTRGPAALNAIRTLLILSAFSVFAVTSFAGMISPRSTQFLHLVANVFEACCVQFFYESIVNHLRVNGFFDQTSKVVLQVPPCCCCLSCLPTIAANVSSVRKLRTGILATIVIQFVLETLRLMRVMECKAYPLGIYAIVIDVLTVVVFMFAMWGLVVFYKSGQPILAQYNYTHKFVIFKMMILTSRTVHRILYLFASMSMIDHFHANVNNQSVMILSNKSRVYFWTNFITVICSTLLLLCTFGKYKKSDYWPWVDEKELQNGNFTFSALEFKPLTQKPTDHDSKPTDHDSKATDHDSKATEHDSKATDHDSKATDHDSKPISQSQKDSYKRNSCSSKSESENSATDSDSLKAILEPHTPSVREEKLLIASNPTSPEFRAKFIPLEVKYDKPTEEIVIYFDD